MRLGYLISCSRDTSQYLRSSIESVSLFYVKDVHVMRATCMMQDAHAGLAFKMRMLITPVPYLLQQHLNNKRKRWLNVKILGKIS